MENEEVTHDDDSEEVKEPDILSADPNERKLARRMRIQRRLETQKKQSQPPVEDEDEVEDVEKTLLEEQVENSAEQLEKLLLDGKELVTNVRVANDAREVQRREVEVQAREDRLKKLEDEAALAMEKFEAINDKWQKIADSNDPLDMHLDMELQKVKCLELLEQKNAMIEELRKELVVADERFNKDQKKQKEDLALAVERIDNQVNLMHRAYREELKLIEQAIGTERKQQLEAASKKWEQLDREREKQEVTNMDTKFEQVKSFEEEMQQINIDHQERMRETKIKLETDIQVLQQELEQVKALCLLNSEKLDYNFQVLKKRDEENLVIRAQQKRRLNKLQDVVSSLRKKIHEVQTQTETEQSRLTAEVIRLHKNIIEIEKKADHFSEVNDTTYHQVWEMNQEEAKKILDKILTTDQLIHEQQLGLDWQPPDQSLLEAGDMPSYRSAMKVVQELFSKKAQFPSLDMHPPSVDLSDPAVYDVQKKMAEQRLLRHILSKVADNSGFLVEERLETLLQPYSKAEKTLIKIDNVFSALGVKSEADMELMRKFFMPYVSCAKCERMEAKLTDMYSSPEIELKTSVLFKNVSESLTQSHSSGSLEVLDEGEESKHEQLLLDLSENIEKQKTMVDSVASSVATTGVLSNISSFRFTEKTDEEEEEKSIKKTTFASEGTSPSKAQPSLGSKKFKPKCAPDHNPMLEPIYVLKGLRDFITHLTHDKEGSVENMRSRLSKKRSTISRLLSREDVTTFWVRFRQIFLPEREKLWDGLFMGLQKYHAILEDRHKINVETEQLREQNTELRRLLQTYLESEHQAPGVRSPRSSSPANRKLYKNEGQGQRPRNPNKKCNCNYKCFCKC